MVTAIGFMVAAAVLGAIGSLVYFLARGDHSALTFRNGLRAYLTIAYLLSLGMFLVGAAFTLTAGMAALFGHDFSYAAYSTAGPAVCPEGPTCRNYPAPVFPGDTRQQDDLIRGLSLLVAGLVLGAAHRGGRMLMEGATERRGSGLSRAEEIFATSVFGLVSIVAIPVAAYSAIRYNVVGSANPSFGGSAGPPGPELAVAVVFLPAWLYYLSGVVRRVRSERAAPPA